ncbi:MAG: hypothetical protein LBI95_00745 [Holosporales bacterium]|nr:hypothetical protein [Holosporales bacterium]
MVQALIGKDEEKEIHESLKHGLLSIQKGACRIHFMPEAGRVIQAFKKCSTWNIKEMAKLGKKKTNSMLFVVAE